MAKKRLKSKISIPELLKAQTKKLEEIEEVIQELKELPKFEDQLTDSCEYGFYLTCRSKEVVFDLYLHSGGDEYDLLFIPIATLLDKLVEDCKRNKNHEEDDIRDPSIKLLEDAIRRIKAIT